MKIKTLFFLFFILFFCNNSFSQKLNITDLELIYDKFDDELDTYLSSKGFDFNRVLDSEDTSGTEYLSKITIRKTEYLSKIKYNGGNVRLVYTIIDPNAYASIKQSISKLGYVFVIKEAAGGKLKLKYKKDNLFLIVCSSKIESLEEGSYNEYQIIISNQE